MQGFAAHVANPDNLRAIAPSLTPAPRITPAQPAPDFFGAGSGSSPLSPQTPQVSATIAPKNLQSWFNPAPPAVENPEGMAGPGSPMPAGWFNPTPPQVVNPLQQKTEADQQRLTDLQNKGAGVNQIQSKPGRILGKIGDVAASILIPNAAQWIPGTTAHNLQLQDQERQIVADDQSQQQVAAARAQANAQLQDTVSQTGERNARAKQIPELTELRQRQLDEKYSALGYKPTLDANGNPTGQYEPDPQSPQYQKIQVSIDLMKAHQEEANANAELKRAGNDQNSPAYKLAVQKAQTAARNARAAETRAQAYMGNYLQGAYNTGLNGEVLPGATQIQGDDGGTVTVGTKNASQAAKSQSGVAEFNDVYGALDSADKAAENLVSSGGQLNSPAVIQAFKQPESTIGQYLQSELVNGRLTPQERDYVTALKAAHENVQAMRKSAGGTATDSSVAKLDALIPGPNTPDLDYFKRQTGQIRSTANRLSPGVTTASGGLTVNSRGSANSSGNAGGSLPPAAAAQLQEGHNTTFGNGQVWTLKKGKPARVK